MLTYQIIGRSKNGGYLVGYKLPGCEVMASVCECRDEEQADAEVTRLHAEQIEQAKCIRTERQLCGLGGIYPELEG